uniref:DNA-directed RNA polymerase n=1 Tax=Acrobeloides nanus TaxID=290746 RepID=A0A914CW68_9BILA
MDCDIASYHVESYNYLIEEGLRLAAHDVPKEKFRLPNGDAIEFGYVGVNLGYPILDLPGTTSNKNVRVYPAECRQRGLTYRAPLKASISISINGRTMDLVDSIIGDLPIMVRSKRCHLANLSEEELVRFGEEPLEKGGYFICKGMEKVMRLLVANKRNFPIALERKSMRNKGKLFSQYAILMRCIRENLSASIITMHYLESANLTLAIQFRRELFYVPLMYILKALTDFNDSVIYNHLIRARPNDTFWAGCVTNMLANALEEGIINRKTALIALGSRFRIALGDRVAPWETDEEAARYLLNYCVCIHLKQDVDKFFCLTYMAQKLMALVKGEILSESPDNPQFQEASVSGHIILLMLRERLENVLIGVRKKLEIIAKRKGDSFNFTSSEFTKALTSMRGGEISRGLEYFLATGNLITRNGLGLMQTTGFAVVAERINQLRFVSHFRAIHRGSFFTEMRTTDVRKLRPEAWGFICPVHTPDGSPCGLLNHVTASCRIVTHYPETKKLNRVLAEYGVIFHATIDLFGNEDLYPVFVDGNFVGYIPIAKAAMAERHLRVLKVGPTKAIPSDTEIVLIRHSSDPANVLTQFPGLYLFTDPGRLIRPVKNLAFDQTEWIG